ncbi:hypothetical protein F4808DRAFT_426014 [Astrocystis sublimbata]|nr:hypothetical protein F4808DRAFT_426014 [Astrocystis sublimbata]
MSGFEVVGIVLGAIPLLISALEHYERGMKTIQIVRRRAKVMHSINTALSTEQTILRNTCETLLAGIIDPKDMKPLLEEPFGRLWQDPDTQALVERRLDHTLKDFKALVHSMKETVEEIRLKLGLGPGFEIKLDDGPLGKRDMIKIALQFSTHEDSLKRLSEINQKLDLMMAGNLRNEPYRKVRSQENLFNLLQSVSRSIYNALKSSMSCACAQSHGIGFGLPTPRVATWAQNEEALVKRLKFHLVLTNKPQDGKGKAISSWMWDEIILRIAEVPIKVHTAAVLTAATDVVIKRPRFPRVRFLDDDTATPSAQVCSPISRGELTPAQGLDTSRQIVTNHLGHISTPLPRTRHLEPVKDLCRTLNGKRPGVNEQNPYGYLLDETTQKQHNFEVFPLRSYDNGDCTSIHLRDFFSHTHRPSLARKYHIAATAASSVLFMHNTLWMPTTLTTKDVFLISRCGNVDFNAIYLAKKSLYDKEGSTTAHHLPSDVRGISTLYYLGVFLMEVMLWKSVYEFWDDENIDLSGVPLEDIFDYTTAKGFARVEGVLKRIEWIGSPEFRKVVEHCIKCDFNVSTLSLDDDSFRHAVYGDIVLPLQDADRFAGGKMTAAKGNSLTPRKQT